jgi:hypothetical protein
VLARLDVDDVELSERLAERGILIRPGSEYGLPGHARVTACPPPLLERFRAELMEVSASLRDRAA